MREGRGFAAASLLKRIRAKQKRKPDKVLRRIYAFPPNKPKKVTVKTRRYKQDAKDKAFRRGAYSNVRDPRKTQSDNVLRRRYAFRPNKPIKVTVKTRRYKQDAKPADFAPRVYLIVLEPSKNASQTKYCTVYTRFPQINRKKLPSKRADTSKTRRTRLSAGERTQMYVTQGKRSPTMYCDVDTRFALSSENVNR